MGGGAVRTEGGVGWWWGGGGEVQLGQTTRGTQRVNKLELIRDHHGLDFSNKKFLKKNHVAGKLLADLFAGTFSPASRLVTRMRTWQITKWRVG